MKIKVKKISNLMEKRKLKEKKKDVADFYLSYEV
jgi:hypothetical protein